MELDEKNKKLIYELEKDGRASFTQIAKRIGVSKEVAQYRFNKLKETGILKRQFILFDNSALGLRIYRLIVDLHNLQKGTREKISNYLRSIKNVDHNVFIQGRRDIEIIIYVRDPIEFHNFYEDFISNFSDKISHKSLSIITEQIFLGHSYLHNKRLNLVLGKENLKKHDGKDEEILNLLSKDPRIQIIDIAKKTKLSSGAVLNRLKKLNDGVIKGYGVVLDKDKLDFSSYRVGIILNDLSKANGIIEYLSSSKEVTKIQKLIGETDIGFEADFKTAHKLDSFLHKLRIDLPSIKDFEVTPLLED